MATSLCQPACAMTCLTGRAGLSAEGVEVEGRWPETNDIIPKHGPLATFRVNPAILCDLLDLAVALLDEEGKGLTLLFYGKDKPVGLSGKNASGQCLDMLMMPLG